MLGQWDNWGYRKIFATLTLCVGVVSFAAAQEEVKKIDPTVEASELAAINAELEVVAKEIATMLKHPGFRGQLRGEINGAQTVEGIIELERFLEKTAKQKKAPPGLAKTRGATGKAAQRIKASPAWDQEGIDLYFPVESHNAKWKGNEDLLVAYAPVDDEEDIKKVVAFSVKSGKRVELDAGAPPETPVLMVAAEEHETHQIPVAPRDVGELVLPADDVQPDATGIDPEPPEVEHSDDHSRWGLRYVKIYRDGEHWTRGSPEVDIQLFQSKGNYCYRKYCDSPRLDKERTWYYTWGHSWYAWPFATMEYSSEHDHRVYIYINERDGGHSSPHLYQIKPGVNCSVSRRSGDDRITSTTMSRTYFPYGHDHYHLIRDQAYLIWRKETF